MTKLYTSRYSNKDLAKTNAAKAGITRGWPKFKLTYETKGNVVELAPPGYIFGMENRELFKRKYFEHLNEIGVDGVKRALERVGYGTEEAIVLLCYEDITKPGDWCHRKMFAEWWESKTGERVEEWPDENTFETKNKKDEKNEQLKMF